MKTRFTPSLETLGERLSPSIWDPTAGQTRQVSIVVDLAPPDPSPSVSAAQAAVPSVTNLVIDPFDGRAAGVVTGRVTSVVVDPAPESGDECLVFFLGGIPSGAVPPEYVYGTELPDADAARRNLVTNLSMDVARPGDPASGTHVLYQDIFIPPA